MKEDSDPSYSQEFESMPLWDRSFWLSRAFIEASRCLCSNMLQGDFSSQYSSSRVILHLARQGIELFLKAAISATTRRPSEVGHDISKLLSEYKRIYPDAKFGFQIPCCLSINPNLDLFYENDVDPKYFHATLDQRHRYPADRAGKDFATPEVFDPKAVFSELEELARTLGILEFREIKPLLRTGNAL